MEARTQGRTYRVLHWQRPKGVDATFHTRISDGRYACKASLLARCCFLAEEQSVLIQIDATLIEDAFEAQHDDAVSRAAHLGQVKWNSWHAPFPFAFFPSPEEAKESRVVLEMGYGNVSPRKELSSGSIEECFREMFSTGSLEPFLSREKHAS